MLSTPRSPISQHLSGRFSFPYNDPQRGVGDLVRDHRGAVVILSSSFSSLYFTRYVSVLGKHKTVFKLRDKHVVSKLENNADIRKYFWIINADDSI